MNSLDNPKLSVSETPPYDSLQAFMRYNHIALEGKNEGALAGMVFAIKDVFKVLGSTYSNGHPKWLETHEPDDFTSPFILKLLEAGADLVGKTVCDELCYSISGENWHYGSPLNPHDARRLTGGSSGGTGAAVAGGLVDVAFGSDCLGSVRVPASYNGVLGIRPTYQRIENDGEAPYCKSMDVLGYVAKEPPVFKQVSDVLLGADKHTITYKKVWIAEDGFESVDAEVKKALSAAVEHVGHRVEKVESGRISDEGLDKWVDIFQKIQGYEVWESYGGWIRKYQPTLPPGQKARLLTASKITLEDYHTALKEKDKIKAHVESLIEEDTLLCLPTVSSVAPLRSAGLKEITQHRQQSSSLLCVSPLSGTPQVTLPIAEMEGMPLGLSLIGAPGTDRQLVEFSADCVETFDRG